MSGVDLHPEVLLDRFARGELSAEETSRLRAHLAVCAACRFECLVRQDFWAEPPVTESSNSKTRVPRLDEGRPMVPTQRPLRWRAAVSGRRRALLLVAAALLIAGVSFAHRWTGSRRNEVTTGPSLDELHGARRAAEPDGVAASAAAPVAPRSSSPSEPVAPRSSSASEPIAEFGSSVAPRRAAGRIDRARPTASASREAETREASLESARALFSAANRARRSGQVDRALELYRKLQTGYPDSPEAGLSRATVAALLLDSNQPEAALDSYDHYLAQRGSTLDAEALVGRALSLQRLGRRELEIAAWQVVLNRFPGTVYAGQASARLRQLGAP